MFAQANELVAVADGVVALGLLISLGILLAVLFDEWSAGTSLQREHEESANFFLAGEERGVPVLTVIQGGRAGEPPVGQPRPRRRPTSIHVVPISSEASPKRAARRE